MNPAYAPPLRLVLPFFILGLAFLLLSCLGQFSIILPGFFHLSLDFVALAHLFLLGFVMLCVVGTLCQLLPVVLESKHAFVGIYALIAPLLGLGVLLLLASFLYSFLLFPYAASCLLAGFLCFLVESTLSILKGFKKSFTHFCLLFANICLLIGLVCGTLLAFSFLGFISFDPSLLFKNHLLFVFSYLYLIILSVSLVLIPMFWISHKLSFAYAKAALGFFILFILSFNLFTYSFILLFLSLACFLYQLYLVYAKRARKSKDIYFKEVLASLISLAGVVILSLAFAFLGHERLFLALIFLLAWGFLAFLIYAHLYKILPFLIWYKVYSPLVGKAKVPSFAQMIPKSSELSYLFHLSGVLLGLLGILLSLQIVFIVGCVCILIAALILLKNILFILTLKENHQF